MKIELSDAAVRHVANILSQINLSGNDPNLPVLALAHAEARDAFQKASQQTGPRVPNAEKPTPKVEKKPLASAARRSPKKR